MRARHAALVTVRARYVSDGATSLPHGLHQPGGPRPTPSSCGAHSAWLSASQTYKRGSAPPPRSGVPNLKNETQSAETGTLILWASAVTSAGTALPSAFTDSS